LTVIDVGKVPEHRPGQFSFAAFNRDFLSRREGFSMLVLDSTDARADVASYQSRGLRTYEPFDFSRNAILPSGEKVTVGFSLAFATDPASPEAGFFTCQQHAPQHFWRSEYQHHANGAVTVLEVAMVADDPEQHLPFLEAFTGGKAVRNQIQTARGKIVVDTPSVFAARCGFEAPGGSGARFAGYTIGVESMSYVSGLGLTRIGHRYVCHTFGAAIAFEVITRQ
jgi:Glyoxalase-like domain